MSSKQELIEALNDLLCDLSVFYQKTRNYHWNVKGPFFFELHVKFEEIYKQAAEMVDSVAERISGLGGTPRATLSEYLKYATIEEDLDQPKAREMVANLAEDMTFITEAANRLKTVADEAADDSTIVILDDIQAQFEVHAWMFAAFLEE